MNKCLFRKQSFHYLYVKWTCASILRKRKGARETIAKEKPDSKTLVILPKSVHMRHGIM